MNSSIGLNLKPLKTEAIPERLPKVSNSRVWFCCLGKDFQGVLGALFAGFRSSPVGFYSMGVTGRGLTFRD